MSRRRRSPRKRQGGRQAGPLRVLPVHHRGPRGHQGQGAEAAGLDEGGRRAAGVHLQADRPRRRRPVHQVLPLQEREAARRRRARRRTCRPWRTWASRRCRTAWCGCSREYENKDLAYVGGTETKYVPIGDRVEVNVGRDPDITIARRLKDQQITNVVARQYKRRLDDEFVLYYDLIDYDETFVYEEEIVSGKPVDAQVGSGTPLRRQRGALGPTTSRRATGTRNETGAYVDLHEVAGPRGAGRPEPRQVLPRPEAGREAAGRVTPSPTNAARWGRS